MDTANCASDGLSPTILRRGICRLNAPDRETLSPLGWVAVREARRSVGRGSGEIPSRCGTTVAALAASGPPRRRATTQTQGEVAWVTITAGSQARGISVSDIRNARASSNLLTAETLSSWCNVLNRTFRPLDVVSVHTPTWAATTHHQIGLPTPTESRSIGPVTLSVADRRIHGRRRPTRLRDRLRRSFARLRV